MKAERITSGARPNKSRPGTNNFEASKDKLDAVSMFWNSPFNIALSLRHLLKRLVSHSSIKQSPQLTKLVRSNKESRRSFHKRCSWSDKTSLLRFGSGWRLDDPVESALNQRTQFVQGWLLYQQVSKPFSAQHIKLQAQNCSPHFSTNKSEDHQRRCDWSMVPKRNRVSHWSTMRKGMLADPTPDSQNRSHQKIRHILVSWKEREEQRPQTTETPKSKGHEKSIEALMTLSDTHAYMT